MLLLKYMRHPKFDGGMGMLACPPCQGHKERKLGGRRQQQEVIVRDQAMPPYAKANRPQRSFLASCFRRVPSIFMPGLCVHDNSLVTYLHQRGSFQPTSAPACTSVSHPYLTWAFLPVNGQGRIQRILPCLRTTEARDGQSPLSGYSCSGWSA